MVSIEEYKKALGSKATEMNDEQIRNLMSLQDDLANALFDGWIENIKKHPVIVTGAI